MSDNIVSLEKARNSKKLATSNVRDVLYRAIYHPSIDSFISQLAPMVSIVHKTLEKLDANDLSESELELNIIKFNNVKNLIMSLSDQIERDTSSFLVFNREINWVSVYIMDIIALLVTIGENSPIAYATVVDYSADIRVLLRQMQCISSVKNYTFKNDSALFDKLTSKIGDDIFHVSVSSMCVSALKSLSELEINGSFKRYNPTTAYPNLFQ